VQLECTNSEQNIKEKKKTPTTKNLFKQIHARNERDIADATALLNYDKCKGLLIDSQRGTSKEVLHQKK